MTDQRRLPDRLLGMSAEVDDTLESLREENEALLVRIAHLEATREEYRRQMAGLLNSWSWRVTAPLRTMSARARMVRRRIRQVPERVARRPIAAPSCTAGLFPPEVPAPGGLVTAASPLLAQPELTADRRQPRLLKARRPTPACSWWRTCITPRFGSISKIGSSEFPSPTTSWSRWSTAAPTCWSPRSGSGSRTR